MIDSSAPGKLVIAGEYAVLEGAPAIAMAVDVRAHARVDVTGGPGSRLSIPDDDRCFDFSVDNRNRIHWDRDNAPGRLGGALEAAVATLDGAGLLPDTGLPALGISLSSRDFYTVPGDGSKTKLGLGSSAAIVVALCDALLRVTGAGDIGPARLLKLCGDAHRRLQGGVGSGIDVMTAVLGGVIGKAAATGKESGDHGSPAAVSALDWPQGLQVLVVWSGRSASTTRLLARFRAFGDDRPARFRERLERLCEGAAGVVAAWSAGSVAAVLESLQAYADGLLALDREGAIGIYSAEHLALRQLALDHGVVYKPSGAGGGDFGLLLMESEGLRADLVAAVARAGFSCLTASLGGPGLCAETLES